MHDNIIYNALTLDSLGKVIKEIKERSRARWAYRKRIVRTQKRYIYFFDWLKNNCNDLPTLMICELTVDCAGYDMPIPFDWSEKLKPWMDKYKAHLKEKERVESETDN